MAVRELFNASPRRVITRIKGGIGNQLFCYAAARRLALTTGAELIIDDVTGFIRDDQYKRVYALHSFDIPCRTALPNERLAPLERQRRAISKAMNRFRRYHNRSYIEQKGMDFDPRLLDFKVRGTVYLDGLWQSENYFKDVESIIREDLGIVAPKDSENLLMAQRIKRSISVAVHVRWFDAPGTSGNHNATDNYYHRAIQYIASQIPDSHFFVFSDDPAAARTRIPLPDNRLTCVSHNSKDRIAYADLWLMTLCRHFVIANSTFSWWGAWLGGQADKVVISPGNKLSGTLTSWGFKGLIPETWIQV